MDMQNVSNLVIPEGDVRTIHDDNGRLLWGKLYYDTKYKGDTEQQTYSGKNLFNKNNYNLFNGYLSGSPTGTIVANANNDIFYIPCKPNTTYSISKTTSLNFAVACSTVIPSNGSVFTGRVTGNSAPNLTITTDATASYLIVWARNGNIGGEISRTEVLNTLQIEIGSPTAYEPYVGGVPSPNPDYPQDVHVVTGTQTVTISDGVDSQSYAISLGSIELAKIGTYQDYIYKSGDNWYVHKAIGKVELDGSNDETWGINKSGTPNFFYRFRYLLDAKTPAEGFSNIAIRTGINSSNTNQGFDYTTDGELRIRYGTQKTVPEWRSFLSTTPMVLYYPLATPTDTQITDTNLITQLNNIHQFLTRYGYNSNVSGNLPIIIDKTDLS